jgi:hypothetical protein
MAEAPYPSIKKHRHCDDPAARTIADPVWFGIMVIVVTWIALIPPGRRQPVRAAGCVRGADPRGLIKFAAVDVLRLAPLKAFRVITPWLGGAGWPGA